MPFDSDLDTVVIGAGQAGLALAHYLRRDCRRFVVLEAADRLGDSWRRRWDSLTLFTPRRYDALPGMRFPGDPEGYPGKDEAADYLDSYASQFYFPVRLGRAVRSVRRDGAGGFVVDTTKETFHARQVVVATGAFTGPVIPGFAGRLGPDVVQLHSSAYRNPGSVPEG
ncbi:MAG TPA: NAD(P)/FAD-dependent oxidoreductase, partial [Kineosporiaceae bacterium]|nr:NAD(P)/FAD-dependent oxidoreductase [Kineosporiaceae bacterium]